MADTTKEVQLLDLDGLTYYDLLLKNYIKTADVGSVGGHTVAKDVPADAVFTDTTYNEATEQTAGLMSAADKTKMGTLNPVSYSNSVSEGVKIGTLTIGTTPTDVYAPASATPNDATLTIKKNGTSVGTFTANASQDKEINIEVPDAVTESTVSGWGFTKNNGTVTGATIGGTVQTVTNGIIALPTYPTTLPASDVKAWAKADNKPTYTASEVGALPDTTVIPTVSDTYSSTSSAAMSGKAVASAISGITQFDYEVVSALPTTGVKGKIYLVANSSSKSQNIYDEYIWITDKFEKLGTTELDISGKQDKLSDTQMSAVDSGITSTKVATYDGYATTIGNKVDKVDGKGLSTNDYTTDEKNKLAGIAEGATANVGTITGIKMNGASKGTSGVVDLGTVITDISGKADVATTLAGYGITDAKIDSGVITLGSTTITPLTASSKIAYTQLDFATQAEISALFTK